MVHFRVASTWIPTQKGSPGCQLVTANLENHSISKSQVRMKNPTSRVFCLRVYRRNEGTYRTCGSSALPIATVPLPVAKGQRHPFLQLLELKEHPNDIKAEQTSDGTELGTRATSQRPQSFENKMCFGNVSGAQPPDERDYWDTIIV